MKNLTKIFLITIWLNQLFGLFGILYVDFDLFLSLSPLSLVFTFLIVFFLNIEFSIKSLSIFLLIFFLSYVFEIIGVNYGLFFGSYKYGSNLGILFFGVPLVIGLNWFVLTVSCGNIAQFIFSKNKYFSILFGSFLMLLLDIFMEQVSGDIDFWYFNDENLLFNYFTWFILGICNQYLYKLLNYNKNLVVSINIYLSFLVFFIVLYLVIQ